MPWLGQEQRISFGSEDLVAFEEGHSKEIGDFTGAAEAEFFVEAHRARERCRGIECNSRAILAAKFSFSVGEQLGGDPSALAGREDGHTSQVAFVVAYDLASDGAGDLAGRTLGDENLHMDEAVLKGFRSEDGIEISVGGIRVAVGREGGLQAGQDFRSVVGGGAADGDCREWR